ncbi:MAG: hypothetical protein ACTHKG_19760 [Nocardioides sp.]
MSVRSAAPRSHVHSKDVTRAWISVALLPVGVLLAFVVGEGLATLLGHDTGSGEIAPLWVVLAAGVPAILVALVPAGFAVGYGLRARRAGDQRGVVPVIVACALAGGFVAVNAVSYVIGRVFG